MSDFADWLAPLILLEDHDGDWDAYVEALYAVFRRDFVDDKPFFQGRRLGLKRYPVDQGKEATFWHLISEGRSEADREIDLRRCERIGWPRPIIEHGGEPVIKVWRNRRRGNEERICLWFEEAEYLVILADRGEYILPWTAYPVIREHRKRKLRAEYAAYWRSQGRKS